MHPAFSVIFFTSVSGAGFGLLAWLGALLACGRQPSPMLTIAALLLGAVLAAAGLCSSVLHLGQPLRAWRAFSQWRSSWLSREGILALATYLPLLWLLATSWSLRDDSVLHSLNAYRALQLGGLLLALLSLATIACTGMIYASLKPVPAWTHPLVVPVYLLFGLLTGGLLLAALLGLSGAPVSNIAGLAAAFGAVLLWRLKRVAWRSIDAGAMPATRNQALGLPHERAVRVFERPHTEANYLLKEMGYVVARKHAGRLRAIALVLFALLPALLALPVWLLPHLDAGPWMAAAALSALLGAFVERWLFFAEARHLVTLYY
jgi:DMSO reductase anchor subunit